MKRTVLAISLSMLFAAFICGCGTSATSKVTEVTEVTNVAETTEAQTSTENQSADQPITAREALDESMAEGLATSQKSEVDWQDYVDPDEVFNMDQYAEALGYTVIKADKSHSWYIFDTVQYHYCIIAHGPTLNIMFDSYDVAYAINVVDSSDNPDSAKICTQSYVVSTSEQWIEESSSLLRFIATSGPSEEEIHNFSGVKTIPMGCTKWSEKFVTDERGVTIDNHGSSELYWKKNW